MPDFTLPQQRFPDPVMPPTPKLDLGAPGAHPSVLQPYDPTWTGMLPRGPSASDMISAAELGAKMRQTGRQDQGRNALAQLYQNPANIDANGNLKPEALTQLAAGGYPEQMLSVMGTQAETMQRQAQLQGAATKVRDANRQWLIETVAEPAVVKYEDTLKQTGSPQQAQAAAQEVYSQSLTTARGDGRLTPQEATALSPQFDYNRARANVLGLKGVADAERARAQDTRENAKLGIAQTKLDQDTAGTPDYKGMVNGKEAALIYRPGQGFFDAGTNQKVEATGIHKIGTKDEAIAEEAGKPTGPADLHGEDYLKALPDSRAAMIKGYAEGRVAFPGSFALRSPYWQKMVADITQYDPSFDAVNYNARSSTRKDFTSGKSAQNITSFNTAIGHLGTLEKAGEKLSNTWSPAWNSVANFLETQTGDPRVKEFNVAAQAVASELTRAFRGTGGSMTEVEDWKKSLDAAGSPEQITGAIRQGVNLLASRINAVGEQYRRGMGMTADVTDLLTPAARKTLAQLPGGDELVHETPAVGGTRGTPQATESSASPNPQTPRGVLPQEAIDKLKEGKETTFSNGQVWSLQGGNAVRVR